MVGVPVTEIRVIARASRTMGKRVVLRSPQRDVDRVPDALSEHDMGGCSLSTRRGDRDTQFLRLIGLPALHFQLMLRGFV
jgi:hypothetical protein